VVSNREPRYVVAFRVKNTNDFIIRDIHKDLSLEDAEREVAVFISNCGRSYEDIKIYRKVTYSTMVKIKAWNQDPAPQKESPNTGGEGER
jgi:hypothetical protein